MRHRSSILHPGNSLFCSGGFPLTWLHQHARLTVALTSRTFASGTRV